MLIYYVLEFFATWLECGIGILTVCEFSSEKIEDRKKFLIASTALTFLILICNQIRLLSLCATVGGLLGIAAASSILCRIKFRDSLILSMAYIIIIYITDFLSISILSMIFENRYFGTYVIQDYSLGRVCHVAFTKLLLIAGYFFIFRKLSGKASLIRRKIWVTTAVLGILVTYFGEKTIKETKDQLLVVWIFFALFIIFYSYIGIKYFEYLKAKEYVKLAEERNELLAKKYENLIENYRDNQIRNHDLKNHYLVIKELVKNKEFEKLENYVEGLEAAKSIRGCGDWTGMPILDQLLEYKKEEAQKNNICFEIVSDRIELKLNEMETVALFGNALDNALESCEKIKDNEKWVRILIRRVHNMVFIKIMNSMEGVPASENEKFLSAKEDKKKFGWGMISMQTIVEKYNGSIDVHTENGVFTLLISFFD